MEWAALITWVITALFGFTMLTIWLRHGGMRQSPGGKIPPWLIFGHFGLAASGLVLWIVYVATDTDAFAWVAFIVLAFVAVLGWTMFLGLARRREAGVVAAGPAERAVAPPERRFPVPVVALHGLFAVTTVVLVFLAALGVGD
jgi:hypothetical protein